MRLRRLHQELIERVTNEGELYRNSNEYLQDVMNLDNQTRYGEMTLNIGEGGTKTYDAPVLFEDSKAGCNLYMLNTIVCYMLNGI
jgi:hypothetical protein